MSEEMTREEAIMVLKNEQPHCGKKALFPEEKKYEAFNVAIKALEAELATKTCNKQIESKLEDAELARDSEETCNNKQVVSKLVASEDAISRQAVLALPRNKVRDLKTMEVVCETINVTDIETLPPVTPKQSGWIPVEDALPEEMQKVLVWEKYYSYKRERYMFDYNFGWIYKNNFLCEGGGIYEVLAWMPLPTPYEPHGSEVKG